MRDLRLIGCSLPMLRCLSSQIHIVIDSLDGGRSFTLIDIKVTDSAGLSALFLSAGEVSLSESQGSYVRRLSGSFTHTASDATVAGQRHEWSQRFF